MKCPKCNKKAKQAIFDFNVFICDCLGYIEDIQVIESTLSNKAIKKTGIIKEISSSPNVMSEIVVNDEIIYFDHTLYKSLMLNKGLLVEFEIYDIFTQEDINKKYPLKAAKNIKILF